MAQIQGGSVINTPSPMEQTGPGIYYSTENPATASLYSDAEDGALCFDVANNAVYQITSGTWAVVVGLTW